MPITERRQYERCTKPITIKIFYKGLPMKRGKEPEGKHHPYCAKLYKDGHLRTSWNCICELLKSYDKWRNKNEKV